MTEIDRKMPTPTGRTIPDYLRVPAGWDEAAAGAIRMAREGAIGILDPLKTLAIEVADSNRAEARKWVRARHNYLAQYSGQQIARSLLVIVGETDPANSPEQNEAAAEDVANTLVAKRTLAPDTSTALVTMVSREVKEPQVKRLREFGTAICNAVEKHDVPAPNRALDQHAPYKAPGHNTTRKAARDATYTSLAYTLNDWDDYNEISNDLSGDPRPYRSLVIVANPSWPLNVFNGFKHRHIHNGGMIDMRNEQANLWTPLNRPWLPEEPAMEIEDDKVPRQRFKRGAADPLEDLQEDIHQTEPVSGR